MLREERPVTSLLTLRKEDWWKGKVVAQRVISFKFVLQLNFLKKLIVGGRDDTKVRHDYRRRCIVIVKGR